MGKTQKDKEDADIEFQMNMYVLIVSRGGWLQYKWKCLEETRMNLADLFYWAVSERGDEAYWVGKTKPMKEIK